MMVPVGRLVVLRTTEKHNLIHSITYITWPGLVAPVVGPPLGGFITTYASWHWVFFLNVPFGIPAVMILWHYFHERPSTREHVLDYDGAADQLREKDTANRKSGCDHVRKHMAQLNQPRGKALAPRRADIVHGQNVQRFDPDEAAKDGDRSKADSQ